MGRSSHHLEEQLDVEPGSGLPGAVQPPTAPHSDHLTGTLLNLQKDELSCVKSLENPDFKSRTLTPLPLYRPSTSRLPQVWANKLAVFN